MKKLFTIMAVLLLCINFLELKAQTYTVGQNAKKLIGNAENYLKSRLLDYEAGKNAFKKYSDSIGNSVENDNALKINALEKGIADLDSSISSVKQQLELIDWVSKECADELNDLRYRTFSREVNSGEKKLTSKRHDVNLQIHAEMSGNVIEIDANSDSKSKITVSNGEKIVYEYSLEENGFRPRIDFDYEFNAEPRKKFDGHLAGVFLGVNGLKNISDLPQQYDFFSINESRSLCLDIYFMDLDIRFSDNCGLVTGMDLCLNHYAFDKLFDLKVEEKTLSADFSTSVGKEFKRANLRLAYLGVPLIFEYDFPLNSQKLYFQAGVKGSLRVGSRVKQVYNQDGNKKKNRVHDDFETNLLRYSFIAGAGFGSWQVFGEYSPVELFKKNHGPEVYPFAVGVKLNF